MNARTWHGRRVLVTGHTGFKGAWLVLWLAELGVEVTGFAAPPPSDPSLFALARAGELVDDQRGDVRDPGAVRAAVRRARPEVVLHLAAQALVRASVEDPAGTYEVNVLGTARLLDAVRELAPEAAVVVVTSDKCYARGGGHERFREEDPLGGADPYSSSKAAQELVAAAYRDAYGLRVATARAGNVIGGGDWARDRLVPDLVRAALVGEPLVVRHPGAVRPWQHVLDPLAGYLTLAERLAGSPEWAQAWNFGPDPAGERPVRQVVEQLRERWPEPLAVGTEAPDGASVEAPALRLDSSKARERLGWAPRWDLDAALDATVAWHTAICDGADARDVTLEQVREYAAG